MFVCLSAIIGIAPSWDSVMSSKSIIYYIESNVVKTVKKLFSLFAAYTQINILL
jgi:hypothetical protein